MDDWSHHGSKEVFVAGNIYADKSAAIVLDWVLMVGVKKDSFCLRDVTKDREVALGFVQRVFGSLVLDGMLQVKGNGVAKSYSLKKGEHLLKRWLEDYSIVKKCTMWPYRSAFEDKKEMIKALGKLEFSQNLALALQSAADVLQDKNVELQTLELYIMGPGIRSRVEEALKLTPQDQDEEQGHEVMLIEPYYKRFLQVETGNDVNHHNIKVAPPLLTFLDLYHLSPSGRQRAESLSQQIPELKRIYKKK